MVDEADIYIGVFAHRYGYVPKDHDIYIRVFEDRYGYVPKDHDISVTEIEYNRAVERKIARLIFIAGKDHLFTEEDFEVENADKLKSFKDRVGKENIINFFNSPADLRAHAINGLSQLRVPDLTAFHYVSDIPAPPEPFIAHPYTLLQTHRLVGRQAELNLLTGWVAKPDSEVYRARILNIVAIGGMGKSALTWKWFNEIAPLEMKPLSGRMWWSFYESDASFENFVTRALAYVTRRRLAEVGKIPAPDREAKLLATLDHEPFLIVLDGLERMLIAYARMDAAHLSEDEYDQQTENWVANAYGLSASAAQSFTGKHRLRKTADPRAGAFLRRLTTVRATRILVSTRLYPADLQTGTGNAMPGCYPLFLKGLEDNDALELWRTFGVVGERNVLLPLFHRVDKHPLVLQSLASEVACYRRAPGDFNHWRSDNPDFDPFKDLPLVQVQSHVLAFALRGLGDRALRVLQIIATFRMPAPYDTLAALLISVKGPCTDEPGLDAVLTELEDRGLIGWDKRANRYDLHPLVRGVVWNCIDDRTRVDLYSSLHAHFEALPNIDDYMKVSSLDDLTPTIEFYNTLIGLRRYDAAGNLYYERLEEPMSYRLCANRQRAEFLEMLFPNGLNRLPLVSSQEYNVILSLAQAYHYSGQPGHAANLYRLHNTVTSLLMRYSSKYSIGLYNLSKALRLSGGLNKAETASLTALVNTREQGNRFGEAFSLMCLGVSLAAKGDVNKFGVALQRALRISVVLSDNQLEGIINSDLAHRALYLDQFSVALSFANRAWELAHIQNCASDFIRAACLQGVAALGLDDFITAYERLHHALTRARTVNLVEEELPALIALAELRRRQGQPDAARELLDSVWDAAERGPYPLFHADALNVLAQLERDAGHTQAGIEAATEAYRHAWCDGPPYAYHWGLTAARRHLQELGAPEPELPPYDSTQHEPMPEVEINPRDEFYVEVREEEAV